MREMSVYIAGASGPEDARHLLEKAIVYYHLVDHDEQGKLIMSELPGGGCAQVFVWGTEGVS